MHTSAAKAVGMVPSSSTDGQEANWDDSRFEFHEYTSMESPDGTVVRAEDVPIDGGVRHLLTQAIGHQKVVDAPPGVVLPGVEAVAPPGVGAGDAGVPIPEGIGEAGG